MNEVSFIYSRTGAYKKIKMKKKKSKEQLKCVRQESLALGKLVYFGKFQFDRIEKRALTVLFALISYRKLKLDRGSKMMTEQEDWLSPIITTCFN